MARTKKENENVPQEAGMRSNKQTKKVDRYWRMMKAQSGVLYLEGMPGTAKSAIVKKIAKMQGLQFFDIRLAEIDESEVSGIPYQAKDADTGEIIMKYALPEWAVQANKKPSLIFFDEINRAPLPVRNSTLQILLDRAIGHSFKFNDDVYMVAAGNLGDEDDCEVEELDSAQMGRLLPIRHELAFDEWVEDFANDNIIPSIISFLNIKGEFFYRKRDAKERAQATPRNWTFLSDYICANFEDGKKTSPREFFDLVNEDCSSYIGAAAGRAFVKYLADTMALSIKDIIERWNDVAEEVEKANRDKKSELLHDLRAIDVMKLDDEKCSNICKFLDIIDKDELTGYMKFIMQKFTLPQLNDAKIISKLKVLFGGNSENYKNIVDILKM